jgi:predicted transcriptional regulator
MSHSLTIELSDAVYAALQRHAQSSAQSPAEAAAAALEQHFGTSEGAPKNGRRMSETDKQAARQRFERHFGAINLGYATGADNEGIDADLARAYADTHEED